MTADDLFSCIGGHALGLGGAGVRTLRFCERDAWRRRVLAHHFPGVPIHDDIHAIDGLRADIITGGPPCQRTAALAAVHGYRTGETLWPQMLRVILGGDYRWIIVEQPASAPAAWFASVSGDLAGAGWGVRQFQLSAWDVGADHTRRRVFTVAHRDVSRLAIAGQALSREADRIARGASAGNAWLPGPSRRLRVADGVSGGLDGYSAGRRRRIEALGDSNPPAMMTAIGRAILAAEG